MNRIVVFSLWAVFAGYSGYAHLHPGEPRASARMTEMEAYGFTVWRENNCQACHQLYGTGGYLGPDLTNVTSRRSAGHIESTLTRGSPPMPRFELDPLQREGLLAFLNYVDATGHWPPRGWPPPDFNAGD